MQRKGQFQSLSGMLFTELSSLLMGHYIYSLCAEFTFKCDTASHAVCLSEL